MLGSNRDHRQKLRDAAVALGAAGAKTFAAAGVALERAFTEHNWQAAIDALFTKDESPRKFSEKIVGIERVRVAQDLLARILQARTQHTAWQHQQRLMRLARVLLAEYAALKRERGWVDMPDLERAAQRMLADRTLGAWVQQRLDARTRHLLIDEFQDTNPLQWQALSSWLASYAGAGSGERPSVFIVGDPKQSIYRFRRAEPQVFQAAQRFVSEGLGGTRLACDHTRRNAPDVLAAVNAAMEQAHGEGLIEFRLHSSGSGKAGAVLSLPQIARPAKAVNDLYPEARWRDTLSEPRETVGETLRTLEARQAAHWIARQIAQGAAPRDFMVLSRRRAILGLMHSELRALHISAAVAEKAGLMDCCEVQDVVALLESLVSPRHSLSLARALKSPLFGLGDDDLVAVSLAARSVQADLPEDEPEPGWLHVLSKSEMLPLHLQGLHAVLLQYQGWLGSLPPHDALSLIFHHANAPARFAAAAPAPQRASVLANLGALLQATLALQGARYTTAYGLVRQLKAGEVQAPAQTAAEAVQLLTVHGAKGLEAPTVILLDTDAQAVRAESVGVLVDWPGEAPQPRQLVFLASESRPPNSALGIVEAEQHARDREEVNALYVAMTRAQERLVISSSEPHVADPRSWWQRLRPLAQQVEVAAGPQPTPLRSDHAADNPDSFILPELPAFTRKAGVKRASPAVNNVANEAREMGDAESAASARVGQAMHRLLEWQPTGAAAAGFAASRAQEHAVTREFGLLAGELDRARLLARNIREGQGRWAWDESLIAWHGNEVELVHRGALLRVDRLVQLHDGGSWWVLDYKSAHRPDQQALLVEQMQAYRAAVQAVYPGAPVKLGLLAGDGKLLAL
jgi:ATP-dependent helicase/nuclease subunit A